MTGARSLELSSFKCGHDAPIYTVIEETIQNSGTPYFSFKDIDENKPTGSIRIRVETIGYFLKRYREDLARDKRKRDGVAARMEAYEAALRTAAAEGRPLESVDAALFGVAEEPATSEPAMAESVAMDHSTTEPATIALATAEPAAALAVQ